MDRMNVLFDRSNSLQAILSMDHQASSKFILPVKDPSTPFPDRGSFIEGDYGRVCVRVRWNLLPIKSFSSQFLQKITNNLSVFCLAIKQEEQIRKSRPRIMKVTSFGQSNESCMIMTSLIRKEVSLHVQV